MSDTGKLDPFGPLPGSWVDLTVRAPAYPERIEVDLAAFDPATVVHGIAGPIGVARPSWSARAPATPAITTRSTWTSRGPTSASRSPGSASGASSVCRRPWRWCFEPRLPSVRHRRRWYGRAVPQLWPRISETDRLRPRARVSRRLLLAPRAPCPRQAWHQGPPRSALRAEAATDDPRRGPRDPHGWASPFRRPRRSASLPARWGGRDARACACGREGAPVMTKTQRKKARESR